MRLQSWILVTDIDGTLLGDAAGARHARDVLVTEQRHLSAAGARLRWVIATGRRVYSAKQVLHDHGFELACFDAFITSSGAELYLGNATDPHDGYQEELARSGFDTAAVKAALAHLPALTLQPEIEQCVYKVSYFATGAQALRDQVTVALEALPFRVQATFSGDRYLDVTPRTGSKGAAVQYLLGLWDMPPKATVAVGDSGNDLSMLKSTWPSIVVGNGHDSLRELRGRSNTIFTTARYASGVIEGLLALQRLKAPSP